MDYNTYLENMQLNSIQEEFKADRLNFLLSEAIQFRSLDYIKEDSDIIMEGKILNIIKDFFRNLFELIKAFFAKIFEFIKDIFDKIKYKLFEKFPRDLESKFDAVIKKIRNESYVDNSGDVDYIFESESNNTDVDYIFETGNQNDLKRLFTKAFLVCNEYYSSGYRGMKSRKGYTQASPKWDYLYSPEVNDNKDKTDEEDIVGDIVWYPRLWNNLEKVTKTTCENAKKLGVYIVNQYTDHYEKYGTNINKEFVYKCVSGVDQRYNKTYIDLMVPREHFSGQRYEEYDTTELDGSKSKCLIMAIVDSGLFKDCGPIHLYTISEVWEYRDEIEQAAFNIDKWKADANNQFNQTKLVLQQMQRETEKKSKMLEDMGGEAAPISGIKNAINLTVNCLTDYSKNIEQAYAYMNKQAIRVVSRIISVGELIVKKYEKYEKEQIELSTKGSALYQYYNAKLNEI